MKDYAGNIIPDVSAGYWVYDSKGTPIAFVEPTPVIQASPVVTHVEIAPAMAVIPAPLPEPIPVVVAEPYVQITPQAVPEPMIVQTVSYDTKGLPIYQDVPISPTYTYDTKGVPIYQEAGLLTVIAQAPVPVAASAPALAPIAAPVAAAMQIVETQLPAVSNVIVGYDTKGSPIISDMPIAMVTSYDSKGSPIYSVASVASVAQPAMATVMEQPVQVMTAQPVQVMTAQPTSGGLPVYTYTTSYDSKSGQSISQGDYPTLQIDNSILSGNFDQMVQEIIHPYITPTAILNDHPFFGSRPIDLVPQYDSKGYNTGTLVSAGHIINDQDFQALLGVLVSNPDDRAEFNHLRAYISGFNENTYDGKGNLLPSTVTPSQLITDYTNLMIKVVQDPTDMHREIIREIAYQMGRDNNQNFQANADLQNEFHFAIKRISSADINSIVSSAWGEGRKDQVESEAFFGLGADIGQFVSIVAAFTGVGAIIGEALVGTTAAIEVAGVNIGLSSVVGNTIVGTVVNGGDIGGALEGAVIGSVAAGVGQIANTAAGGGALGNVVGTATRITTTAVLGGEDLGTALVTGVVSAGVAAGVGEVIPTAPSTIQAGVTNIATQLVLGNELNPVNVINGFAPAPGTKSDAEVAALAAQDAATAAMLSDFRISEINAQNQAAAQEAAATAASAAMLSDFRLSEITAQNDAAVADAAAMASAATLSDFRLSEITAQNQAAAAGAMTATDSGLNIPTLKTVSALSVKQEVIDYIGADEFGTINNTYKNSTMAALSRAQAALTDLTAENSSQTVLRDVVLGTITNSPNNNFQAILDQQASSLDPSQRKELLSNVNSLVGLSQTEISAFVSGVNQQVSDLLAQREQIISQRADSNQQLQDLQVKLEQASPDSRQQILDQLDNLRLEIQIEDNQTSMLNSNLATLSATSVVSAKFGAETDAIHKVVVTNAEGNQARQMAVNSTVDQYYKDLFSAGQTANEQLQITVDAVTEVRTEAAVQQEIARTEALGAINNQAYQTYMAAGGRGAAFDQSITFQFTSGDYQGVATSLMNVASNLGKIALNFNPFSAVSMAGQNPYYQSIANTAGTFFANLEQGGKNAIDEAVKTLKAAGIENPLPGDALMFVFLGVVDKGLNLGGQYSQGLIALNNTQGLGAATSQLGMDSLNGGYSLILKPLVDGFSKLTNPNLSPEELSAAALNITLGAANIYGAGLVVSKLAEVGTAAVVKAAESAPAAIFPGAIVTDTRLASEAGTELLSGTAAQVGTDLAVVGTGTARVTAGELPSTLGMSVGEVPKVSIPVLSEPAVSGAVDASAARVAADATMASSEVAPALAAEIKLPSITGDMTAQQIEQSLTSSPIVKESIALTDKGGSGAQFVTLEDGTQGVWKSLSTQSAGQATEVAAFRVNELLGLDSVPVTVVKTDINGVAGTLQYRVTGVDVNADGSAIVFDHHPDAFKFFDQLISQGDRQTDNILSVGGKPIAIDNANSFLGNAVPEFTNNTEGLIILGAKAEEFKTLLPSEAVYKRLVEITPEQWKTELSGLLSDTQIKNFLVQREGVIAAVEDVKAAYPGQSIFSDGVFSPLMRLDGQTTLLNEAIMQQRIEAKSIEIATQLGVEVQPGTLVIDQMKNLLSSGQISEGTFDLYFDKYLKMESLLRPDVGSQLNAAALTQANDLLNAAAVTAAKEIPVATTLAPEVATPSFAIPMDGPVPQIAVKPVVMSGSPMVATAAADVSSGPVMVTMPLEAASNVTAATADAASAITAMTTAAPTVSMTEQLATDIIMGPNLIDPAAIKSATGLSFNQSAAMLEAQAAADAAGSSVKILPEFTPVTIKENLADLALLPTERVLIGPDFGMQVGGQFSVTNNLIVSTVAGHGGDLATIIGTEFASDLGFARINGIDLYPNVDLLNSRINEVNLKLPDELKMPIQFYAPEGGAIVQDQKFVELFLNENKLPYSTANNFAGDFMLHDINVHLISNLVRPPAELELFKNQLKAAVGYAKELEITNPDLYAKSDVWQVLSSKIENFTGGVGSIASLATNDITDMFAVYGMETSKILSQSPVDVVESIFGTKNFGSSELQLDSTLQSYIDKISADPAMIKTLNSNTSVEQAVDRLSAIQVILAKADMSPMRAIEAASVQVMAATMTEPTPALIVSPIETLTAVPSFAIQMDGPVPQMVVEPVVVFTPAMVTVNPVMASAAAEAMVVTPVVEASTIPTGVSTEMQFSLEQFNTLFPKIADPMMMDAVKVADIAAADAPAIQSQNVITLPTSEVVAPTAPAVSPLFGNHHGNGMHKHGGRTGGRRG